MLKRKEDPAKSCNGRLAEPVGGEQMRFKILRQRGWLKCNALHLQLSI